jgi:hypothetical protein
MKTEGAASGERRQYLLIPKSIKNLIKKGKR